jgi:hypothetical protein
MSASRAALVVLYNHKYDRNIPKVEAIYRDRFPDLFHLVPFYSGAQPNVIPVYENSMFFQGYIAQGARSFVRPEFAHYIFAADDMVLNPAISAASYRAIFKLDAGASFLPLLESLPASAKYWPNYRNAVLFDPFSKYGVEVRDELPSAPQAARLLARHGVVNGEFSFIQVYGRARVRVLGRYLVDRLARRGSLRRTRYPLARSYADLAIVSAACIREFCHYCGVFAATDLFVELAIPTALAFAAESIVMEKDLALRGKALWSAAEQSEELDRYGKQLGELIRGFPPDCLYIHPVKLSTWSFENL